MSEPLKIVITANGEGSRMKALSPKPKHLLYYGGKRIIDCIVEALQPFGRVYVFGRDREVLPEGVWMGCTETANRKAQLELLRNWENVLIVDCDVIPVFEGDTTPEPGEKYYPLLKTLEQDAIWCFESDNPKYGGLEMSETGTLSAAKERGQGHKYRASGLYLLKHVGATVDRMTDPNSIAAAMIGARMVYENTFIRVGDPEDYLNALK
ncbi:MAG: NTP transferase domain-containing protein [Chitinophagaceae bacterium]|nr:NTP transferase domain-containing protein [Chitinophagaceae bacterium]